MRSIKGYVLPFSPEGASRVSQPFQHNRTDRVGLLKWRVHVSVESWKLLLRPPEMTNSPYTYRFYYPLTPPPPNFLSIYYVSSISLCWRSILRKRYWNNPDFVFNVSKIKTTLSNFHNSSSPNLIPFALLQTNDIHSTFYDCPVTLILTFKVPYIFVLI